jgi:ParB/RepB/Spo0J family partition protein
MTQITLLPVTQLTFFRTSASRDHSNQYIDLLALDIRKNGIKKPLIVRPVGDLYQVVCGLARLKAVLVADITDVPAEIRQLTDQEAAHLALIDNLDSAEMDDAVSPIIFNQVSEAELAESIREVTAQITKRTIEGTPTFMLKDPLPVELCDVLRNDFRLDEMTTSMMSVAPKADPKLTKASFERFAIGLNGGVLHIEGSLFGMNETLLTYLEAFLDMEDILSMWMSLTPEREQAVMEAVDRILPKVRKILGVE